jgi:protein TonB
MFENSLFASGVSADRKRSARQRRWFALASVGFQGLVLAAFLVVPMIFPATLPALALAPKVVSLVPRKPPVKVEPKPVRVETANSTAVHAPSQPMVERRSGGVITPPSTVSFDPTAPSLYTGGGDNNASLSKLMVGALGAGPGPAVVAVSAEPKKTEPIVISQGVSKGMLLSPIQPIYPRIAIAAHVQGTVVVTATIDKQGRITGLQVLSGPEMLKNAAADAIKDARYKPFLLSGVPTDVITTISVTFRLGV